MIELAALLAALEAWGFVVAVRYFWRVRLDLDPTRSFGEAVGCVIVAVLGGIPVAALRPFYWWWRWKYAK